MATQNILNETFDATVGSANHFATVGDGHLDNTGWTGSLGSGSVLDADSTDIADALGGATEILKVQKVSANFNSLAIWDSGSELAKSYFHVYINCVAEGLGNGNTMYMAGVRNASSQSPWLIQFNQSAAGVFRWDFSVWNNGAKASTTSALSLSTWYRWEVYYDTVSQLYEARINGSTLVKGALTGTYYAGPRYFRLGNVGDSYTTTTYFDLCYVDSNGFQTSSPWIPKVIMVD